MSDQDQKQSSALDSVLTMINNVYVNVASMKGNGSGMEVRMNNPLLK